MRDYLVGHKFNRLEVKEFDHTNKHGDTYWKCLCDCGKERIVCAGNLKNGHTKSCGCIRITKTHTKRKTCEVCGIEMDGSYGSGRFCSASCRGKYTCVFTHTDDSNKRRAEKVREFNLKRGKLTGNHLAGVRRGVRKRFGKDPDQLPSSLSELASQTRRKVLAWLKVGCSRCGWNVSVCDLHHIHGRKIDGANSDDNLSCLCPNCHRMAHMGLVNEDELISIKEQIGDTWKAFYVIDL